MQHLMTMSTSTSTNAAVRPLARGSTTRDRPSATVPVVSKFERPSPGPGGGPHWGRSPAIMITTYVATRSSTIAGSLPSGSHPPRYVETEKCFSSSTLAAATLESIERRILT